MQCNSASQSRRPVSKGPCSSSASVAGLEKGRIYATPLKKLVFHPRPWYRLFLLQIGKSVEGRISPRRNLSNHIASYARAEDAGSQGWARNFIAGPFTRFGTDAWLASNIVIVTFLGHVWNKSSILGIEEARCISSSFSFQLPFWSTGRGHDASPLIGSHSQRSNHIMIGMPSEILELC